MKLKCFESTDSNGTEQYLIPLEDGSFIAVPKATTYGDALRAVKEQPSIDIVRCKECKCAHMTSGGDCKYCDMWKDDDDFCIELYLDGDFYCAYGEREGE